MKKTLLAFLLPALLPGAAAADINVTLPAGSGLDSLTYYTNTIERIANGKSRDERRLARATAPVKGDKAVIAVNAAPGGSRYVLEFGDGRDDIVEFYALPGDNVTVAVASVAPLEASVSGTPLIESMNEVEALSLPVKAKQQELVAQGKTSREDFEPLYREYIQSINDYIEENLTSPNAVTALLSLDGEDFVNRYDRLSEGAKTSALYPIATRQYESIKESLEQERMQAELANGTHDAPGFTLNDLEGKPVSLSQFKGKWVILDFWGSWCGWCIKGFPELKEAYAEYAPDLEIIGIDCNEDEGAWRAGVVKYGLSWVNVYCPKGNPILKEYGIQGFPTKAIVNPEGKLVNITTGHNPDFFVELKKLMGRE